MLGDIPVLGWLFKTKSESVDRVNLYIFLTPRIIRNPAEANAVTDEKKADATFHHESGWAEDTFRYKENREKMLESRHGPETIKADEHGHEQPKTIE